MCGRDAAPGPGSRVLLAASLAAPAPSLSPRGCLQAGRAAPSSARGLPLGEGPSAGPVPAFCLSLLAQVGKTSLIMALVGEEFPEEVSGSGGTLCPGWRPWGCGG